MANHKRGKPKNARAGCLMCKPHKMNGAKDKEKISVKRNLQEDGPCPCCKDRWPCDLCSNCEGEDYEYSED